MPQIPKELIDSVVILLDTSHGLRRPIGTAFVLTERGYDLRTKKFYLITCEHCVEAPVTARFSNGETISIISSDWTKSPSAYDIVAMDITEVCATRGAGVGFVDQSLIVEDHDRKFDVGTDLFKIGLFPTEQDTGTNLPTARFGNLSVRAHENFPTLQGNGSVKPTHIGDMRSRAGFSGSPVFGYWESSAWSDVRTNIGLLGVHSAQYDDWVTAKTNGSEQKIVMPAAMTKIVPAWTLRELIAELGSG